jgi:serine protease Do
MEIEMTNTLSLDTRRNLFRRTGAVLALGIMIVWSGLAHAELAPDSFSNLAKKVSPSVVWIATTQEVANQAPEVPFNFPEGSPFEKFFRQFRNGQGQNGQPRIAHALGSGFIIDPGGYIVTNNHVIDHATAVKVKLASGDEYDAKIVGTDQLTDLALLKVDAKEPLPAVSFGDSDHADVGDWVMAVGNPFGLGGTVTAGIISARGRNIQAGPYDDFLQVDAPINKGNSGGPLFNLDGKVIGVNTAIFSPNGGSVGIGFAIPSNLVKPVIAQIRENGQVERGWLGVQIQGVTADIADAMGLDQQNGALVSDVIAGSPAEQAGFKSGDVIVAVDGNTVENPRDLARLVAQRPVGDQPEFTLWRDGKQMSLVATLGKMPPYEQLASGEPNAMPGGAYHSKPLGADLASLTDNRRAQFDVPDDVNGVVILDVGNGPAMDQGLRPGDVIREVAQTDVTTPRQVDTLIRKNADGNNKAVLLLVNRQGRDIFVGLKPGVA